MKNDYIYVTENASGMVYYHYDREEAFDWYERYNGIKIIAKTKDLFPTIKVIVDAPNVDIRNIREDDTLVKTSVNKRKYIANYDNKNTKQVKMKLNYTHDAAIIEKLKNVDNVQGYIKSLILADIEKNK